MIHSVMVGNEGYQGLNPIEFGYEDCNKSHFFGPAVRSYWLLHFVVSGKGIFRANGKEYVLEAGEIFVIPPFLETFYQADAHQPWSYIWIGFTTDGPLPSPLPDTIHCPEAFGVFQAMKQSEQLNGGRSAFLSARLWDLFALFLKQTKTPENYVQRALDCIHSEYMHGITVEQIAQRLNLDRSYFSTLFKETIGIPPKQYLQNHRLHVAASLLVESRKSISVVAASVGYTDVFTFSKMFKKHLGLSPSEYVKKHT